MNATNNDNVYPYKVPHHHLLWVRMRADPLGGLLHDSTARLFGDTIDLHMNLIFVF